MGILNDSINRLHFNVTSPDGSVVARFLPSGVDLELVPFLADAHTDQSLARQVERVLTSLLTGYRMALVQLRAEILDTGRAQDMCEDAESVRWWRYAALLAAIEVQVDSASGCVSVTIDPAGRLTITVVAGSLRRFGRLVLAFELTAAVLQALLEHDARTTDACLSIQTEVYELPPEVPIDDCQTAEIVWAPEEVH